jgi:8-oxo-dGTP diphosphatase
MSDKKIVAKLVMIDQEGCYLMMWRSDHPTFGRDFDLPGGTLEAGESSLEAVIREVHEEAGVNIEAENLREVYRGSEYSKHGTQQVLYAAHLCKRPDIVMSWEHSAYEWVSRDTFLKMAKTAQDPYMHMVGDQISRK